MSEALYFKVLDNLLFIKAQGHITAALCVDLREKVTQRLAASPVLDGILVDLFECDYMDSTFMGLLVGFNKKFKASAGKPITICRPSEDCQKLLQGLGISKLLEFAENPVKSFPKDMELVSQIKSPTTEILLNAHQNLSELSPENERKFSILQTVLKNQLEKERSGENES